MFVVVKLVSGAELIGELVEPQTETKVVLSNPMQVVYTSTTTGVPVVSVHKFCPFAKKDVYEFKADHVMCLNELSEVSSQYYKDAISTTEMDDKAEQDVVDKGWSKRKTRSTIVH
jgi:hypothetical protein